MIHLFDANNWVRIAFERDKTGLPLRGILNKMEMIEGVKIVVWDGLHSSRARKLLFPGYKSNRPAMAKDMRVNFDTTKEVLNHANVMQVEVPNYEADDVIAALARHYASQGQRIAIYSTDWDYAQLVAEYPTLIFAGYNPATKPVDPEWVVEYKVFVGDASDALPGIPGFGPTKFNQSSKMAMRNMLIRIMRGYPLLDEHFEDLAMKVSMIQWVKKNTETLQNFYNIVKFFPVDMNLISKHTTVGKHDMAAADAYLKEWMM